MKINLGNVGCFGVGLRIVCYGNMKFCLYGETRCFILTEAVLEAVV